MFKNMEYVYQVYLEKSFSKAAEKLFISQPSLSSTIKSVEDKVGAPIFNRKTKPITLTTFGEEYILAVQKIMELQTYLHQSTTDLNNLQKGRLAIGGSCLGLPYIIPQIICNFKNKYPQLDLIVLDISTLHAKQSLDNGTLDLIITNRPLDDKDYEKVPLYDDHLIIAVPKHYTINASLTAQALTHRELTSHIHHIPNNKVLPIKIFKDLPFVTLPKENYLRFSIDMLCAESHIVPHILQEVAQANIAYNFASYGLGATIINHTRLENIANYDKLCFYKLSGKYATRSAAIFYRKSIFKTVAMQKFIDEALYAVNKI